MRWGGEVKLNIGESVTYNSKKYKNDEDTEGSWCVGYGTISFISTLVSEETGLPWYYFVRIAGDPDCEVVPDAERVWGID